MRASASCDRPLSRLWRQLKAHVSGCCFTGEVATRPRSASAGTESAAAVAIEPANARAEGPQASEIAVSVRQRIPQGDILRRRRCLQRQGLEGVEAAGDLRLRVRGAGHGRLARAATRQMPFGAVQFTCSRIVFESSSRLSFGHFPTVCRMSSIWRLVRRRPKTVVGLSAAIRRSTTQLPVETVQCGCSMPCRRVVLISVVETICGGKSSVKSIACRRAHDGITIAAAQRIAIGSGTPEATIMPAFTGYRPRCPSSADESSTIVRDGPEPWLQGWN